MSKIFSIILTGIFLSYLSFSEEKPDKKPAPDTIEYVEVLGNIPVSKSIQSVSLIESKKINSLKLHNLKEILSISPGVLTLSTGKFGQSSSTFIRGSKNSQILYLIDGVKIRDSSNIGGINLSQIPAFLIDKVEVVRGPLSSIYGSDAMGGVINIGLKKEKGFGTSLVTGSHGSYQTNFSFGDNSKNIFYSLSASAYNYKDNIENDRVKNIGLNGKLDYTGKDIKSGLLFFLNRVNSGIPYNTSGEFSPFRRYRSNNFMAAIPIRIKTSTYSDLKATISYTRSYYKFEDKEDVWSPYYSNSSDNIDFETIYNTYIGKNINLNSGINYSSTKIFSENSYGIVINKTSRIYFSSFAKLDIDLSNLFFTSSIRFDKYKNVKSNFSPQIGVSFRLNNYVKLRSSYSQSFKAPLLIQQINPWGVSNFRLLPEKGFTGEFGADIFLTKHVIGFSFFRSNYKNMIDWVTVDPETWSGQYQNIKEAFIKGIEISISSSLIKNILLDLSYTYLKTCDNSTGLPLKRRPANTLSTSIRYLNPHFTLNMRMIYVGKRGDLNFNEYPPDIEMPSYNIYDLNITFPIGEKVSVYGNTTNLFNSEYSEIFGYLSPGRRFEIGVTYR